MNEQPLKYKIVQISVINIIKRLQIYNKGLRLFSDIAQSSIRNFFYVENFFNLVCTYFFCNYINLATYE